MALSERWRSANDLESRGTLGFGRAGAVGAGEVALRYRLGERLGRPPEGDGCFGVGTTLDERHALVTPLANLRIHRNLRQ